MNLAEREPSPIGEEFYEKYQHNLENSQLNPLLETILPYDFFGDLDTWAMRSRRTIEINTKKGIELLNTVMSHLYGLEQAATIDLIHNYAIDTSDLFYGFYPIIPKQIGLEHPNTSFHWLTLFDESQQPLIQAKLSLDDVVETTTKYGSFEAPTLYAVSLINHVDGICEDQDHIDVGFYHRMRLSPDGAWFHEEIFKHGDESFIEDPEIVSMTASVTYESLPDGQVKYRKVTSRQEYSDDVEVEHSWLEPRAFPESKTLVVSSSSNIHYTAIQYSDANITEYRYQSSSREDNEIILGIILNTEDVIAVDLVDTLVKLYQRVRSHEHEGILFRWSSSKDKLALPVISVGGKDASYEVIAGEDKVRLSSKELYGIDKLEHVFAVEVGERKGQREYLVLGFNKEQERKYLKRTTIFDL